MQVPQKLILKTICLTALGILLVCSQCVVAAEVHGLVVGVHDGDSLTLLVGGKNEIKVRLEGIDAPELKQPFGSASKKALSDLVFGKTVRLEQTGKDRYKRTLGNIYVDETWINLAMVERGMAWFFAKYSKDGKLKAAAELAQRRAVGLWREAAPQPPWEWRKKK